MVIQDSLLTKVSSQRITMDQTHKGGFAHTKFQTFKVSNNLFILLTLVGLN
jgi:hypothetical protein